MTDKLVMVVEDDAATRAIVCRLMRSQGHATVQCPNGPSAVHRAMIERPDLVILDVMLPIMDGFEVCRVLRKEMSVPVLMLTARAEEIDKIVGLEMGADDYITKPFSMRELLARVKAHLRRVELIREDVTAERNGDSSQRVKSVNNLTFGNLVIDENRREVTLEGKPLRLKPKEFELLLFLARNKGIALSRTLILATFFI